MCREASAHCSTSKRWWSLSHTHLSPPSFRFTMPPSSPQQLKAPGGVCVGGWVDMRLSGCSCSPSCHGYTNWVTVTEWHHCFQSLFWCCLPFSLLFSTSICLYAFSVQNLLLELPASFTPILKRKCCHPLFPLSLPGNSVTIATSFSHALVQKCVR